MLNYILQTANPTSPLKNRLKGLEDEYAGVISLNAMGFPPDWESEKIWEDEK